MNDTVSLTDLDASAVLQAAGWQRIDERTYHITHDGAPLAITFDTLQEVADAALILEQFPDTSVWSLVEQLGATMTPAGTAELPDPPPAAAAIVLLTPTDARAIADRIRNGLDDLRVLIDQFDTAEGWRALGYESFRAWALAEVDGTSLRSVYRLRDAAAVDRSLGVTIGHTPESHARVLKAVPPDERPAVMERAATIAGDRAVQARDIARAAGDPPPAAVPGAFAGLQARAQAIGADLAWDAGEYRVIRPGMSDVCTVDVGRLRGWLATEEEKRACATPPPSPVAPAEDAASDPATVITDLSARLADALAAEHWEVVEAAASMIVDVANYEKLHRGANLSLNPRWLVQELDTLESEVAAGLCDDITMARLDSLSIVHGELQDVLAAATFAAIDDRLTAAAAAYEAACDAARHRAGTVAGSTTESA